MIFRAISPLLLVLALLVACRNETTPAVDTAPPSAATAEQTSGAERGLPEVHSYAHRLDDPKRGEWQRPEEVIELLECEDGMTAVDLGAGTGYFLKYLSKAVGPEGAVLALDLSPRTIDLLAGRIEEEGLGNVRPLVVPPDEPSLAPRSVDRILVVNTWHHIFGRVEYAKKLRETLRRTGLLLIVDFTMESPIGPPAAKRLTRDTVVQELRDAGFVALVLEESLPHQYVIAGRRGGLR
jgi:predicted methyltransferase